MRIEFDAKVVSSGNGLSIYIPRLICNSYKIKKGDIVKIVGKDDHLVIPLKAIEHVSGHDDSESGPAIEIANESDITEEDVYPKEDITLRRIR